MIRDDRFRFAGAIPRTAPERLESDSDSLPFPVGGVFGPIRAEEKPDVEGWDRIDTVDAIEMVINRMQGQLDTLEHEVSDVIAHIGNDGDGGWHPSAA